MPEVPDGELPEAADLSEVEAYLDLAADGSGGPLETAAAFCFGLGRLDDDGMRENLAQLVTPGSLASWGDFTEARDVLAGAGMMSRAEIPAPGMAYARFTDDPGRSRLVTTADSAPAVRAVATLTWQPHRFPQWRVHALGDPVRPGDLPAATG